MSKEAKDIDKKVEELEAELRILEMKFHRSSDRVRVKTLLRMHQLTHDFLIWSVRRDVENQRNEQSK